MIRIERPRHVEFRRAKAIVNAEGRRLFGRRKLHAPSFQLRQARVVAKAMQSRHHPIVAHIIPIRRCNLACTYCNEFDDFSKPVPTRRRCCARIDRLADLGTSVITISGGEPLLHPDLDHIIRRIRSAACIAADHQRISADCPSASSG